MVNTTLIVDIKLWSPKDQKVILVELMVPWEEGCGDVYKRKASKYQSLDKGWQAWLFPVDIGCRDFLAKSAWSWLSALGLDEWSKKQAARRMGEEAENKSAIGQFYLFFSKTDVYLVSKTS